MTELNTTTLPDNGVGAGSTLNKGQHPQFIVADLAVANVNTLAVVAVSGAANFNLDVNCVSISP